MLPLLYVAVVVMAGTLPVGFLLGRLYERERAELRRPPAPHEALARVYQMPDPGQTPPMGRYPISGDPWYPPALTPAEILADLRGPLGRGPA